MLPAQFGEADAGECNAQKLAEEDRGHDDEAMDIYELNDDKRKAVYENVPYWESLMDVSDLHTTSPSTARKAVCNSELTVLHLFLKPTFLKGVLQWTQEMLQRKRM